MTVKQMSLMFFVINDWPILRATNYSVNCNIIQVIHCVIACDQLVSKVREWHFICSINFMLRTNKQNQVFLEALASLEPTMAVCLCVCMSVSVSQLASRSQYIIQMKSDLYETFRTALHCGPSRWSRTSKITLSSKTPVRNLQCPPSMTSRTGGAL